MICPGWHYDGAEVYWHCQRTRLHDGPCWHWADGVWHVWGRTPWRRKPGDNETQG